MCGQLVAGGTRDAEGVGDGVAEADGVGVTSGVGEGLSLGGGEAVCDGDGLGEQFAAMATPGTPMARQATRPAARSLCRNWHLHGC